MRKQLFVSYSSMNAFRKCPRFYYWKHIRRLEKRSFKLPFIVGRVMHHGIQTLLSKPDKAMDVIKQKYKEEAQSARKEFLLSPVQEEDLAAQQFAVVGMLDAYRRQYSQFLKATKHVATELVLQYELNKNVVIVGKIDNVLNNQSYDWTWELKNLKSLDMDRISGIKTDPQSGLYFEVYNRLAKKKKWEKLHGMLYQIIRKPSIRQKKAESRREFLVRLQEWYASGEGGLKFHLERTKGSFISGEAVMNTIDKVSQQMLACKERDDYYQDFSRCISEWDKCQFYGLCHGDEKKEMKLLQIRKPYKVSDEKEEADSEVGNVVDEK